ncbi:hypothetical protein ACMHYO_22725 [Allopusillimonas ginsengisoli]|uniref:hypothetical protein n=1 Tax=Allopusillimonas ginsengisoli TaxID=453575 RepID=UPI0039C2B93A
MKNHDLTKIADTVRAAHANHVPMRIPAMTVRELGILTLLLAAPVAGTPAAKSIH